MALEILVGQVMTRNPIIIDENISVMEAAKLMKKENIGSLILRSSENYFGIITERDILYKVVAEGFDPRNIRAKEIMSHPMITIDNGSKLEEAATIMWKYKIRRLPVVENGKIVGIITENDIIRLSPGLIEITREVADQTQPLVSGVRGYCDKCKSFDENLVYKAGKYYCSKCFSTL